MTNEQFRSITLGQLVTVLMQVATLLAVLIGALND